MHKREKNGSQKKGRKGREKRENERKVALSPLFIPDVRQHCSLTKVMMLSETEKSSCSVQCEIYRHGYKPVRRTGKV
jgi:hypothetical protein